jgi:hypothetical protein
VPPTLSVHVSDGELHDIAVETQSFETAGPFNVELVNHGRAVHVHLNLVEGLERGATLDATNHFVETETVRTVGVDVVEEALPAGGKVKIVTGYGAETTYVDVTVREAEDRDDTVDIDETLAEPPNADAAPADREISVGSLVSALSPGTAPVFALAGVALLVALLASVVVDGVVALLGIAVVLVGVIAAGVILVRG